MTAAAVIRTTRRDRVSTEAVAAAIRSQKPAREQGLPPAIEQPGISLDMSEPIKAISLTCLMIALGLSFSACKRSSSEEDETPDNSTYRPESTPTTEFEQKLKVVRDAHFQYVWVFTRIDGRAFTPEDSQLLHTNAPKVVDWVGMDDKKKFIAGSNFPIEPPNLAALQKRFQIEDYSGK